MFRIVRCLPIVGLCLLIQSCGGGKASPSSPTPPSTPQPTQQNRNPTVSATVSPSWGVDSLTVFTFGATASDPDGDPVTLQWDFGDGTRGAAPSAQKTYAGSGTAHVTVTAADGKGGSGASSVDVVIGSMTGSWRGSIPGYTNLVFTLSQDGPFVTGTFVEQFFGQGKTDPAAPGRIQADGSLEIRFKLATFSDFIFRGRLDSSGRRVTGGVFSSGFNGEPFTMTKQ